MTAKAIMLADLLLREYKPFAFILMTSWIRLMIWKHGSKRSYGRSSGLDWRTTGMKSLYYVSRALSSRPKIQQKRANDWSFKASRTFTTSKKDLFRKTVQPPMLEANWSSSVKILIRTSCLHPSKSLCLHSMSISLYSLK